MRLGSTYAVVVQIESGEAVENRIIRAADGEVPEAVPLEWAAVAGTARRTI